MAISEFSHLPEPYRALAEEVTRAIGVLDNTHYATADVPARDRLLAHNLERALDAFRVWRRYAWFGTDRSNSRLHAVEQPMRPGLTYSALCGVRVRMYGRGPAGRCPKCVQMAGAEAEEA